MDASQTTAGSVPPIGVTAGPEFAFSAASIAARGPLATVSMAAEGVDTAAAGRWLSEVFEPSIAAIPPELRGRRAAAEIFHELLEHRWFLSERAGKDVGLAETIPSYIEKVLQGQPVEFEEEVPLKTVGLRHVRGAYRPDFANDGTIVGWVASLSDVSDRKHTEKALRQAQPTCCQKPTWSISAMQAIACI